MKTLTFVAIALGFGVAPLTAQNIRPAPGERVRIQAVGEASARIFRLKEVIADTLVLEDISGGTSAPARMPLGAIARLQVSEGLRPWGKRALHGAGWGFGGGALVGGIIGYSSGDDEGTFLAFTAEEKAVLAGVTLGAAGLVVGTIIGLASNPEQWRSVPLQSITVAPTAGGALEVGYRYRLQ